jgi:3-phenylpropionate/trans-cinnamate dioxygenase ferredoxin subunit
VIVDVGRCEDFAPGKPGVVVVAGREVLVVRWGDEWFGLRNVCPHQTETLSSGCVVDEIGPGERIGQFRLTGRPLIACPRHVWTFDLRTGWCTVDPLLRVRAYAVSTHDGRVLVDDGTAGPAPEATPVESADNRTAT